MSEVGHLPPEAAEKIKAMQPSDLPQADRRRLYNQLGRRLKDPEVPSGLLEQYLSFQGQNPKRFEILKQFIVDRTMPLN